MKNKYIKEIKEVISNIEKSKNNFQVAICLDKIKQIICEAEKYNRPDIVVCNACRFKGGGQICGICDDGDKYQTGGEG